MSLDQTHPQTEGAGPGPTPRSQSIDLTVPEVHCASCIARIERGLKAMQGVEDARVNLSLKRVHVTYDKDRSAPEDLISKLGRLGFEASELDAETLKQATRDGDRGLLLRLGVAGFAAMNVMLLSVSVWAGAEGSTRDFLHWISAAIALPALVYAARPFFSNAWRALSARSLNMDVPISLAIVLASGTSLYETAMGGPHAYFDAALSLTFFLLLGRYLDHLTRAKARSAAVELAALDVQVANLRTEDGITTRRISELRPGDVVMVGTGGRVPVDGTILRGATELDNSLLTGETAPVPAAAGDDVFSGTVNLSGPIDIGVKETGEDTVLGRIASLVRTAETARTRYTSLADRAARLYAPLVHLLALAAFVGWQLTTGDTRLAITIATAVLIITCPCALGLAVPAVMTAANGRLFRAGVLVRDATALERLAEVDTVVLDKTGTLTTNTLLLRGAPPPEAMRLAAALAEGSSHPLARAISRAAGAAGLTPAQVGKVTEIPGKGIEGRSGGKRVRLGQAAWCGARARTPGVRTWLAVEDEEPVAFEFEDQIRSGAGKMVADLKSLGLEVILLSGDAQPIAEAVARQLGIDQAFGEVAPDKKHDFIQNRPGKVLMVGDGLNDTAALAAAHVSAAPGRAIDAARSAADLVLLRGDLTVLADCLRIARSARRRILENFAIAAAYNAVAIPAALSGLATPLLAALAMSSSSITVSLNALRLRGGRG